MVPPIVLVIFQPGVPRLPLVTSPNGECTAFCGSLPRPLCHVQLEDNLSEINPVSNSSSSFLVLALEVTLWKSQPFRVG